MVKNLVSEQILAPLDQIWAQNFFFHRSYLYYMLDIVDIARHSYHCMQFQRKLMNQTWENSKKPSFGSDFGPFCPNLGYQIFFQKSGSVSH